MNVQPMPQREVVSPEVSQGVRRWLRKQISFLLILAFILFLSAGTLNWPLGWVQLAAYAVIVAVQVIVLVPRSPGLLAERSKVQQGTSKGDLLLASAAAVLLPIATWVIAGLDFRSGWTAPMSPVVYAAALAAWIIGYGITIWAMASNPFFSATVRIQEERGQRVVASGPYAWVRHPGYLGALIFQLATPFMLNSWPALIPSALAALIFVVRIRLEEKTLREGLPGYADYTRRVRYRLLPGIW